MPLPVSRRRRPHGRSRLRRRWRPNRRSRPLPGRPNRRSRLRLPRGIRQHAIGTSATCASRREFLADVPRCRRRVPQPRSRQIPREHRRRRPGQCLQTARGPVRRETTAHHSQDLRLLELAPQLPDALEKIANRESKAALQLSRRWHVVIDKHRLRHRYEPRGRERRELLRAVEISRHARRIRQFGPEESAGPYWGSMWLTGRSCRGVARGRLVWGGTRRTTWPCPRAAVHEPDHPPAAQARRRPPVYDITHVERQRRPDGDSLLISLRHTDSVYKVSRRAGRGRVEARRHPHAREPDGRGRGPGLARLGGQHDPRIWTDGTITIPTPHAHTLLPRALVRYRRRRGRVHTPPRWRRSPTRTRSRRSAAAAHASCRAATGSCPRGYNGLVTELAPRRTARVRARFGGEIFSYRAVTVSAGSLSAAQATETAWTRCTAGRPHRMALRSIWNGTIAFGGVFVPVKVHSATEDRTVHFHEVHVRRRRPHRAQADLPEGGQGGPLQGDRRGLRGRARQVRRAREGGDQGRRRAGGGG